LIFSGTGERFKIKEVLTQTWQIEWRARFSFERILIFVLLITFRIFLNFNIIIRLTNKPSKEGRKGKERKGKERKGKGGREGRKERKKEGRKEGRKERKKVGRKQASKNPTKQASKQARNQQTSPTTYQKTKPSQNTRNHIKPTNEPNMEDT
jgi:hypothetical protein